MPEGLAQLEILEEAGHYSWMDNPGRFWPMIIESTTGREPIEA
ncbi:MAG: hypothetical protein ABW021_00415 [Acidimicrobiia bacterium]